MRTFASALTHVLDCAGTAPSTTLHPASEAADVFRRDYDQFKRNVVGSLRGTTLYVGGRRVTFPALLR